MSFLSSGKARDGYMKETQIDHALSSKSSSIEELPWYAEKGTIRAYLEEINKEKTVGS